MLTVRPFGRATQGVRRAQGTEARGSRKAFGDPGHDLQSGLDLLEGKTKPSSASSTSVRREQGSVRSARRTSGYRRQSDHRAVAGKVFYDHLRPKRGSGGRATPINPSRQLD